MKRYGVLHALVMSPFSTGLYRDVAHNWRGAGVGYLLLLTLLTMVVFTVKAQTAINGFLRDDATVFIDQVPPITIEDGVLSADVEQPYYIVEDPDDPTSAVIAVIDTTGQFNSLEDVDAPILITAEKVYHRENANKTETFEFSGIDGFQMNRDDVHSWGGRLARWAWVLIFPFGFIGSFVYRLIQVLVAALVGLIIASAVKRTLSYGALIRLSAVAITPAIVFGTVLVLLGVKVPLTWLIQVAIGLFYLIVAVAAAKPTDEAPPFQMDAPPPAPSDSSFGQPPAPVA